MPDIDILTRLERGDVLVLDGAMGSELQRRGVNVWRGWSPEARDRDAWSAGANVEELELVEQIHTDYLRVGADIILTNNFSTMPSRLRLAGEHGRWRQYATAAATAALRARDAAQPQAYVAGAFAPPLINFDRVQPDPAAPVAGYVNDTTQLGRDAFGTEVRDHAELLVDAGVDLLIFEYLIDVEDAVVMADACRQMPIPRFVGVAGLLEDGAMYTGTPMAELVDAIGGLVDGLLIMCTFADDRIARALQVLRQSYDGYLGVYAEPGGYRAPPADLPIPGPTILDGGLTPSEYARMAMTWRDLGAQILGGCCGSGPEHISALRYCVAAQAVA